MMIQAPHVVAAVARDLDDSIARLFHAETVAEAEPAQAGRSPSALNDSHRFGDPLQEPAGRRRDSLVVCSTQDGYVQAIDESGLMQLACDRDLLLHMRAQPGDFIATGTPLADVLMSGEVQADNSLADELSRTLNESVVAGIRRTPRQDPECAIEELVEIAVRALSPGINDPFTAMNCIDRLGAALGRLSEGELPSGYRYDDTGSLRLVIGRTSFASALDTAFNQIRQHSQDNVAVTSRLLQALASIANHVQREEDREVVELHTEMVARHIENFAEGYDIGQVLAQIHD